MRLQVRPQQRLCITYVTLTYIFPFGLRGGLLEYRLHPLTDATPCIGAQHRRGRLLHWEGHGRREEKDLCVLEIRASQRGMTARQSLFFLFNIWIGFTFLARASGSF